jgi:hypothetical protein
MDATDQHAQVLTTATGCRVSGRPTTTTEAPQMAGTALDMQQVIDDVLAAESDAEGGVEDVLDGRQGEVDGIDEKDACSAIDGSSDLVGLVADEASASAAAPAGAGGFVSISQLDGVPLFFARGVEPRPQTFSVEPHFRDILIQTVKTVRFRAPASFGALKRITSAGTLVAKPGFHGLGRACDHDAWAFEDVDIRPIKQDHAASALDRRQRYWALAALIRSHSAFVLHGEYNAAHRDHIHQDNGGPRPFTTSSEATVKLVQAICNHIFRESPKLAIDGGFGSKSQAAVKDAMRKVDLAGDIFDASQWTRFLLRSGRLGFELSMKS